MTASAQGKTVLLVEDDFLLREMYRAGLEVLGYHVETAGDGKEGLAAVSRLRPDAIVLDIALPELDGLALLEMVRESSALKESNVVILSNYSDAGFDGERAWRLGIRDYLVKADTTPSRLGQRLAEVIGTPAAPVRRARSAGRELPAERQDRDLYGWLLPSLFAFEQETGAVIDLLPAGEARTRLEAALADLEEVIRELRHGAMTARPLV